MAEMAGCPEEPRRGPPQAFQLSYAARRVRGTSRSPELNRQGFRLRRSPRTPFAEYKLGPAPSHSCPIRPKPSGWQAEGLREPTPPCPKTLSDKERVYEGFSGHLDRLFCVQQALAPPIWGEVVVPLMAAGTAARFLPRRPWYTRLYLGSRWICDDNDRPRRRSETQFAWCGRAVGSSLAPKGATVNTGIRRSRAP